MTGSPSKGTKRDPLFDPGQITGLPGYVNLFADLASKELKRSRQPSSLDEIACQIGEAAFDNKNLRSWLNNTESKALIPETQATRMRDALSKPASALTSGSKLAKWWSTQIIANLRNDLVELLDAYLLRISNELTSRGYAEASRKTLPHWDAAHQDKAWIEIRKGHFIAPPAPQFATDARDYLRGLSGGPLWTASGVAVERSDVVDTILAKAKTEPVILIHAAVGEGKSTVLRQVAARWLESGRRVFEVASADALHDREFTASLQWSQQPLILMDDMPIQAALPPWVARKAGSQAGCILIGVQQRNVADRRRLIPSAASIRVMTDRTVEFIEGVCRHIKQFGAGAPGCTDEEIEALFADGLSRSGTGGMWPAMWQATRGERLDERIGRVVRDLFDDAGKRWALGTLVFVNQQIFGREGNEKILSISPSRTLMTAVVNHLGLQAAVATRTLDAIENLGATIDGELVGDYLDDLSDPVLEFRHPAVTEAFARWIFNPPAGISHARLSTTRFYEALAEAMPEGPRLGNDTIQLMRAFTRSWSSISFGRNRGGNIGARQDMDEVGLPILQAMAGRVLSVGLPGYTRARINMLLASGWFRSSEFEGRDGYGHARLKAALDDPECPPDVFHAAIGMMQRYNIELPSLDGFSKDWRYVAQAHISRTQPRARRGAKLDMFRNIATLPQLDPREIAEWCEASDFVTAEPPRDYTKIIRPIVSYFVGNSRQEFSDFRSGGHAAPNFTSLRSVLRHFWSTMSRNHEWQKAACGNDVDQYSREIQENCREILKGFLTFDRANAHEWPEGAIDLLERSYPTRKKWVDFFGAYTSFFD